MNNGTFFNIKKNKMLNPRYSGSKALDTYLVKEIMDASPQKLLLKVYDFAIQNCQRHDLEKTNKAIGVLINSLSFQDEKAAEISGGLLSLYQYAQDQMRKKNYSIVLKILTDLKESWVTIFNQNKQ